VARPVWIASLLLAMSLATASAAARADQPGQPSFYILAMSWQLAFCEGSPRKPECRTETGQSYTADHFALHGLWPQPRRSQRYCGVDEAMRTTDDNGRWRELPELQLSPETRAELEKVMPGTRSFLDRHEWIEHGTCYLYRPAEVYFRDSLKLMNEINRSRVRDYFAAMMGKTVTLADVRARFDESFGAGAGQRVRVACKDYGGRRLITEITIGLAGDPGRDSLSKLMLASRETYGGCDRGEVAAVQEQ
jgi:ribonuclease T2